jgi:hypothetical protein
MADLCSLDCCGINEFSGIQWDDSPADCIQCVLDEWFQRTEKFNEKTGRWEESKHRILQPGCCHIIFSDANDKTRKYGDNLRAYITKHKLGRVVKTRGARNPNSENTVECFVWTPNMRNLERYAKKQYGE